MSTQVFRSINQDFLDGLEVVSNKIYPLPGATFERRGEVDSRVSSMAASNVAKNNLITFYEHIATVRHRASGRLFVAFRQTRDALMLEQSDKKIYPAWLMKSDVKNTELKVHIYTVKMCDGRPVMPTATTSTHEDWLEHLGDSNPWVFDTLVFYLLRNHIISEEMYGKMQ